RKGHIGIWPSAPAIAKRIVDISAVVGGLRGIGRRMQHPWSLEALWSLETAPNERVATTHQIAIRADRSRVWSINVNRHRRNGCPVIGYNVVAIILVRSVAAIPGARQINVLANNAVSSAARRHRHVGPGGVPRIRDRVVLPGRARFKKVLIKA